MTSGETGLSSYKESKREESKQPLSSRDNNKMKRSLSLLPSIVHSTQHTRLFVIDGCILFGCGACQRNVTPGLS